MGVAAEAMAGLAGLAHREMGVAAEATAGLAHREMGVAAEAMAGLEYRMMVVPAVLCWGVEKYIAVLLPSSWNDVRKPCVAMKT